jgi:hypothetical protein
MKPHIAGFELYFETCKSVMRSQFGASPFLCLERKGAESYPSRDKAVVFIEVPDLQATVDRLAERILQFEPGRARPASLGCVARPGRAQRTPDTIERRVIL